MTDMQDHWQGIFAGKEEGNLTWFQETPEVSLNLIANSGVGADARIIDIGAGASRLADALLERGFPNLTVLDIADEGLNKIRNRLGGDAGRIDWVVADITQWTPTGQFDLWHDRAVFHFLTDPDARAAYRAALEATLSPAGQVIIGTFALDGPEKCSGLPVVRYDGETLGRELGPGFRLEESVPDGHVTPKGGVQKFQFSRFSRV
ncbi:MAG: class I SAM-dependent methyltransferase [Rhodospirillales bacterium]|nr:class I SAM-dependent methyltransferase [Rhodospirillales bacterium]